MAIPQVGLSTYLYLLDLAKKEHTNLIINRVAYLLRGMEDNLLFIEFKNLMFAFSIG